VITRAVIASVGARTPLGLNATQTALLLRTGSAAMAEAPLVDPDGEPITMCFEPTRPLDFLVAAARRS
jgi:3-oxoacyl-[acyl-carrier-protein] synthase-1